MSLRPRRGLSILLVAGVAFCLQAAGCQKYGGASLGSFAMPGTDVMLRFSVQMGPLGDGAGRAGVPLLAIVWESAYPCDLTSDSRNRLMCINGRDVRVQFGARGVYALQQDYTLRRIDLTSEELQRVLALLAGGQRPIGDKVWGDKVKPFIKVVNASPDRLEQFGLWPWHRTRPGE